MDYEKKRITEMVEQIEDRESLDCIYLFVNKLWQHTRNGRGKQVSAPLSEEAR